MRNTLIYIADDEINICNIIKSFLVKEGYEVETFHDGQSILEAFARRPADMLVIDIMMPMVDGYSVCASVRKQSSVPIIIVSAKDTEPDKIAGLTLGSDDYMTKPFSPMELVARVKSIFRRIELDRSHGQSSDTSQITDKRRNTIQVADVVLDPDTKQAWFGKVELPLTTMEFSLLLYLINNKDRPVSRGELLDKIWGFENEVETRATDDVVKRLRKKLSDFGTLLKIETVWGFGFKLVSK